MGTITNFFKMSKFISLVGPQDQAGALVAFIESHQFHAESAASDEAGAKKVSEQLKDCIRAKDWRKFLDSIIALKGLEKRIFLETTKHEVTSFFRLLALFANLLESEATLDVVKQFIAIITNDSATNAPLKAKVLVSTYNMFDATRNNVRALIFLELTKFCTAADIGALLEPRLANLDELVDSWGASAGDARPLYRAANRLLAQCGNGPAALKQQIRFLTTFASSDDAGQKGAVAEAVEAARQAITLPGVFVVQDVFALGAVQKLKNDTQENRATLYSLLKILVDGTMEDFEKLVSNNTSALKDLKIDIDATRDKMRLLTVASACADAYAEAAAVKQASSDDAEDTTTQLQAPGRVSLQKLGEQLGVKETSEAEMWLLRAVSDGLVKVKINQLDNTATVTSAIRRSFTTEDWKLLASQLDTWTNNIDQLLEAVDANKRDSGSR